MVDHGEDRRVDAKEEGGSQTARESAAGAVAGTCCSYSGGGVEAADQIRVRRVEYPSDCSRSQAASGVGVPLLPEQDGNRDAPGRADRSAVAERARAIAREGRSGIVANSDTSVCRQA